MKRIINALLLGTALTQSCWAQPLPNIPPNTVLGRTGIITGPAQAIPFAQLGAMMVVGATPVGYTTTPEQWGAKGDCITDDAPAENLAIAYLNTTYGGGSVVHGDKCYAIGSQINIGNGTVSGTVAAPSTINNIHLIGSGAGYTFDLQPGTLGAVGTRFKYIGAAALNGALLNFAGPITSSDFRYITLDCNGLCGFNAILTSVSRGRFSFDGTTGYTNAGFALTTATNASSVSAGQDAQISTAGNLIEYWYDQQTEPNVQSLKLDGYQGSFFDTTLNQINHFEINMFGGSGGTNYGIWEIYSDANNLTDGIINVYRSQDKAIQRTYVVTAGPACYPASNIYQGMQGASPMNDDTTNCAPTSGNFIGWQGELVPSQMPRDPVTRRAWGYCQDQNTAPWFGSMWAQCGQNYYDQQKNRLFNSQFAGAAKGSTVSGTLTNGAVTTLDGWALTTDGSVTYSVSRVPVTPGNSTAPYNPRYYLKVTVTAQTPGTYLALQQTIPGVQTFQQMYGTCSFWARTDDSSSITLPAAPQLQQFFGSGGSPSTTVTLNPSFGSTSLAVNGAWGNIWETWIVPSIAGKTLGTNGDDGVLPSFFMPLSNAFTFSIAIPQCEEGSNNTAYDRRDPRTEWTWNGTPSGTGPVVLQNAPTINGATLTGTTAIARTNFSGQFYSTYGMAAIASGACGATTNGAVSGGYQSGIVTIGSATTTTCNITFSPAATQSPSGCILFPENAAAAAAGTTVARISSVGTGGFIITGSALANANYYYICL